MNENNLAPHLQRECERCGHASVHHYGDLAFGGSHCTTCDRTYDVNGVHMWCDEFIPPIPPIELNPCQNCGHEWSLHEFTEDDKMLLVCSVTRTGGSVSYCACGVFKSKWGGEPVQKLPGYSPSILDHDEF